VLSWCCCVKKDGGSSCACLYLQSGATSWAVGAHQLQVEFLFSFLVSYFNIPVLFPLAYLL
jgi:hypothetical protein